MDLGEALAALLGSRRRRATDANLWAAAQETVDRRARNSEHGGAIFAELVARGVTYRDIERRLGISKSTVARWAASPSPPPSEATP